MSRRPTLAGRRLYRLTQEIVQHNGHDSPHQGENRAKDTDLVVPAVAFRAVAILPRHGLVPLSVRAHEPLRRPQVHAARLHRAVRMHSMKASHDSCDRSGRPPAPLYLGGYRALAVLVFKTLLGGPDSVPGQRPHLRPPLSRFQVLNPTHSCSTLPIAALSCCRTGKVRERRRSP